MQLKTNTPQEDLNSTLLYFETVTLKQFKMTKVQKENMQIFIRNIKSCFNALKK